MGHGFTVQVDTLDKVARTSLPEVADQLRGPVGLITDHTPTVRTLDLPAVRAMERAYGAFTDDIGNRQRTGCTRIDETAEALRDIVAVYRRVDGQG